MKPRYSEAGSGDKPNVRWRFHDYNHSCFSHDISSEYFSLITFTTKFFLTFIFISVVTGTPRNHYDWHDSDSSLQKFSNLTPIAFMQYVRCPVKRLTSSTVELLQNLLWAIKSCRNNEVILKIISWLGAFLHFGQKNVLDSCWMTKENVKLISRTSRYRLKGFHLIYCCTDPWIKWFYENSGMWATQLYTRSGQRLFRHRMVLSSTVHA